MSSPTATTGITTTEIVIFLSTAFEAAHDVILHHDRTALWRLMVAADEARAALSRSEAVVVRLPCICGEKSLDVRVSRAELLNCRK